MSALRFRLTDAASGVRDKINTIARISEVAQGEVQTRRGMVLEFLIIGLIAQEVLVAIH